MRNNILLRIQDAIRGKKTPPPVILRQKWYGNQGSEIVNDVEYPSFEAAIRYLEREYFKRDHVARLERVKYADGTESISIKGQNNKVILQFKTITK